MANLENTKSNKHLFGIFDYRNPNAIIILNLQDTKNIYFKNIGDYFIHADYGRYNYNTNMRFISILYINDNLFSNTIYFDKCIIKNVLSMGKNVNINSIPFITIK